MRDAQPADVVANSLPAPRLLVELPSRPRVFFGNLGAVLSLRRGLDVLDLRSAPAPFWPDVFVRRGLPWGRFFQSGVLHLVAGAILIGLTHLFSLQPRVAEIPTFDQSQVIYYQPSEYLPPLDTRNDSAAMPEKADPEFSPQPIISVPPEADNHRQTIVTPARVKLKQDIAMPNIVAWSDTQQKPRLAIPPAPLTPAADITRLAPKIDDPAVAPPAAALDLVHRRSSPALQNAIAAPPAELKAANAQALAGAQPALVAPPIDVQTQPTRSLGELNIASSPVVAPAPQLAVAAQRAIPGGPSRTVGGPQVLPPPPSLSASGPSGTSSGSRGQVIALSVHPTVAAPRDPPAGNRRGSFAAAPEGHVGASGTPGSPTGTAVSAGGSGNGTTARETAAGTRRTESKDLPSGLYVGTAAAKTSPAVANPTGSAPASSPTQMAASLRPSRTARSRPLQPETFAKLSSAERALFGSRRFYSVTLNTPNLNSAGGSWVIRFAEVKQEPGTHDDSASTNLSQPMATRTVDPAYPLQLMQANVSGTVILCAVIHADGTVGNVRVLRGVDDRLDRFASEAVAQWKFEPATKNGTPVDVEATFQIPFRPARIGNNF